MSCCPTLNFSCCQISHTSPDYLQLISSESNPSSLTFDSVSAFRHLKARHQSLSSFPWISLLWSYEVITCLSFLRPPDIFWRLPTRLTNSNRQHYQSVITDQHLNLHLSIIFLQLYGRSFLLLRHGLNYQNPIKLTHRKTIALSFSFIIWVSFYWK